MTALEPILVATDFSEAARRATERAALLARQTGAALTLVHVLPGPPLQELRQWLGVGHASELQLRAGVRQQLQQLADALQPALQQPVRIADTSGAVLDELVREADAIDAALLVLGARGTGFLRRLVLGSTCERLLRRTRRPLLVVRQPAQQAYRRVLVALDFSGWSQQAIGVARQVAPQAQLMLLHAFQVPFEDKLNFAGVDLDTIARYRQQARVEAVQRVAALAQAAGLQPGQYETCIVEGEAPLRIVEQERARACDLVVLGKHGRSAAEDLLLGSVTQQVLAEGSTDVLVSTARVD